MLRCPWNLCSQIQPEKENKSNTHTHMYTQPYHFSDAIIRFAAGWCCQCFLFASLLLFYFILFFLFTLTLCYFVLICVALSLFPCKTIRQTLSHTHPLTCGLTSCFFSLFFLSLQFDLTVGCLMVLLTWRGCFVATHTASRLNCEQWAHFYMYFETHIHYTHNEQSTTAQCEIIQLKIFVALPKIGFSLCVIITAIVVAWTREREREQFARSLWFSVHSSVLKY